MAKLRTLKTVEAVVKRLGGLSRVAQMTGRGETAIYNWLATGRMPPNFYDGMIEELEQRGATAPAALWGQRELTAA